MKIIEFPNMNKRKIDARENRIKRMKVKEEILSLYIRKQSWQNFVCTYNRIYGLIVK